MTPKEALRERDRLQAERARALKHRDRYAAKVRAAQAELKQLPRQRRAALRREARTGEAPIDPAELSARERELAAELEATSEGARQAGQAAQAAEVDLRRLHAREFGAFCSAAEELTMEASAHLAALREPYEAAYAAIERARAEWSRIVRDRNRIVLDGLDQAQRAAGEHKRRAISTPPPNPLAEPTATLGGPPIRPPEVEPVEGAA